MSLLTIPNTFTNGTGPGSIIDAVQMNANFTAIATAVNNIYPSQILPITTGQATFGPTATGVGYKFLANDATATPLTVSGVAGQSVDNFAVTLTSGGTKAIFVPSAGGLAFGPTGLPAAANAAIAGDQGATIGLALNVPTGSTSGYRWFLNNVTTLMQLTAAGALGVQSYVSAGTGTQSGSVAPGDLAGSRSATTGVLRLGGSSNSVGIDYNISNAGNLSFINTSSAYITLNAAAFTITSDERAKTNIVQLDSTLAKVMALKPSSFTLKSNDQQSMGLIAQDVLEIFPELVSTDVNGMHGLNMDGVTGALLKAFQEFKTEFDSYVAGHP